MKLETIVDVYSSAVAHAQPRLMMFERDGAWQSISSESLSEGVLALASQLKRWNLRKGDRLAILSENRPEWQIVDFACLLLGIVDVPIYPTQTAEQAAYMLQNSGARALFLSTSQQLEKIQPIIPQTSIERVIMMDDGAPPPTESFSKLLAPLPAAEKEALRKEGDAIKPDDLATIIYTSGTTGTPKGVMLTHGNLTSNLRHTLALFEPKPEDLSISFLPLSHITARHVDYAFLLHGVTLAYCPHMDDLPRVLKERRPTFLIAVPRVYEKVYGKVLHGAARGLRRRIYHWALRTGEAHIPEILSEKRPSSLEWKLADALVFSKIRAGFGGRVRFFLSGGAPLGSELATWYAKVGICIYEGYGLTETSPVIALNIRGAVKPGTVGRVLPDVEARLSDDGELLVRGPNVFSGYWNLPQETASAFVDGWFKTGDIASIDADGFVSITDRKKDLIKTSGGKFIAPQPLETALKTDSLVAQAAVLGDRRKFPCVLIAPNFPALEEWGRSQGIQFSSRQRLIQEPHVRGLYEGIVSKLNQNLAQFEKLKKIILVPDEFSVATGELTPSMKLKRRVVEQKYKSEIDAAYAVVEHSMTEQPAHN
jgi:long-chain acyl-CoA synthetase